MFLSREPIRLDSAKVQTVATGKGVPVSELLKRVDGPEVWVVINGNVYE